MILYLLIIESICTQLSGVVTNWVNPYHAAAGMLGIAYIGFVWMLEAAGIRFLGLGGSSAGAITAGTIASTRERPDKPCSQQVLKVRDPMHHLQGTGQGTAAPPCLFRELSALSTAICR